MNSANKRISMHSKAPLPAASSKLKTLRERTSRTGELVGLIALVNPGGLALPTVISAMSSAEAVRLLLLLTWASAPTET